MIENIETRLDLAEKTARFIRGSSYQRHDVFLFGSTITGQSYQKKEKEKPSGDIDLLILHDSFRLEEFDLMRDYMGGRIVVSTEKHEGSTGFSAWGILEAMGSKRAEYLGEFVMDLRNDLRSMYIEEGTYAAWLGEEKHTGTREELSATVDAMVRNQRERSTVMQVTNLFKNSGYDMNDVLDIHTMSTGYFDPESTKMRQDAINQCVDPTFWHTVLSTGKLYNSKSGKFDLSVNDKYPGAVELFKV